ncbi:MAG: PIN-like domain-containing protein [Cellulosimicrobium funkei]
MLDTNVLLGLYRVSPDLRATRLKVLKAIGPRLFLPHQVGIEFHRNRREVAAGIGTAYETVRAAADALQKSVKTFGGGEGRYDETTTRVKELINPLVKAIVDGLDELEKDDPHRIDQSDDPVLAELETLLDDDQVGRAPRAKKVAKRARDFETVRVPLRLPPGFDEAHKITGRGVSAAAGDYLLWCEVLAHARKNGTDVVLITDDAKTDWWQKVPGGRDVPHPLLVSEFQRETGQRYYQLSTRELLRKADDALAISVTSQNLEEEDELAAAVEAERALERITDFRGRLTVSAAASAVENDLLRTYGPSWNLSDSDRERLIAAASRGLSSQIHEVGHLFGSHYKVPLTPEMAEALRALRQQLTHADFIRHERSEQEPPPEEPDDEGTS